MSMDSAIGLGTSYYSGHMVDGVSHGTDLADFTVSTSPFSERFPVAGRLTVIEGGHVDEVFGLTLDEGLHVRVEPDGVPNANIDGKVLAAVQGLFVGKVAHFYLRGAKSITKVEDY